MANYRAVRIGDICTLEKGKTGISKAKPGKYPLVTTAAERKSSSEYQFDTEAVCIPLVSSTGHGKKSLNYVHYQEGKFALGTILVAIIPNDKKIINTRYLHYYLSKNKDRVLVPLMRGAANVSLSVKSISNVKIPVPPLKKQQEIIKIIDKTSSNYNKLMKEVNKQKKFTTLLRQVILHDAIGGKLTKNWRKNNIDLISGENHASKLLEKIQSKNKVSPIKEDEVPFQIPDQWVW
ncbi:MAG: restriction endonuclease subunit S, partial [Candidatus Cloacimonetes bacterium]|nr:restriction endonuclease subunit S [Candidatus Cloacimonadota bacterium]